MASGVIVHRTARQPAWWLFGVGLAFAAWWGQPLIESDALENHFFGLFWYSMLALGALFWALPAEQRATAENVERRYLLLGLFPLWQQSWSFSAFTAITLEQESGLFGRDSVWLLFKGGEGGISLVFARYRASEAQIAAAQAEATRLALLTGLPFAPDAG